MAGNNTTPGTVPGTPTTTPTAGGGKNNTETGNGKGNRVTGSVTTEPWEPAQPFLTSFLSGLENQFNTTGGVGGNVAPQTTAGIQGLTGAANAGVANQGAGNKAIQGILNGTAGNAANNALSGVNGIANGGNDIWQGGFKAAGEAASQPTASGSLLQGYAQGGFNLPESVAKNVARGSGDITTLGGLNSLLSTAGQGPSYLAPTARGDFLQEGNPYFEAALKPQLDAAANGVADYLSASGRYGSNAATANALGDTLGGIRANALSQNWQAERDRMLGAANALESARQGRLGIQSGILGQMGGVQAQNTATRLGAEGILGQNALNEAGIQMNAAGQIDSASNAQTGNLLSAASGLAGVQGQNIANQLSGAGMLAGQANQNTANQLSAAGLLPSMAQLNYLGPQALLQAGQAAQGNQWGNAQDYLSLLGPIAGLGGTSTQTEPNTPFRDFFGALLGGLGGLGSTFG